MIAAFAKTLAQLREPSLRRLLLLSIALAFATFVALLTILWFALPWLAALLPAASPAWVKTGVEIVTGVGALLLSIILFPGVVTVIQTSLFVDRVCAAVETRHYPGLPPPRASNMVEQVGLALRFLGLVIGLNLVALPFYFVPVLNAMVFAALNGYLIARENFDAVAPRRLDVASRRQLWRRRRMRFWVAGAVFALLMTIPFVNLAAAIVAAAAMTHLVETSRREAGAA